MKRRHANLLLGSISCANAGEQAYFDLHRSRYVDTLVCIDDRCINDFTFSDLGSLPSHLAIALKLAGARRVVGLDYEPDRYGSRASILQLGVELQRCDLESETFPFEDGSVDLALCNEVIEHFSDGAGHCLNEAFRVLRPGGRLLLTTPNISNLANRIRLLLRLPLYPELGSGAPKDAHVREYSMRALCEVVEGAGFIVRRRGYVAGSEKAILAGSFPARIPFPFAHMYAFLPLMVPAWRSYLLVELEKPGEHA